MSRDYAPAGPVVKAFHQSDAFVRVIEGPVGSGKSTGCSVEIIDRARRQKPGPDGKRRTRWAVIRNTFPELQTTTIPTWRTWLPVGSFRMSTPATHVLKTDELDFEAIFLALDTPDDVKKLLSLELTGAWVNECRELPKAVLDMLTGRVGRYPAMVDGGPTWHGVIADTNMPDADHWLYRLAEEERPEGWAFFRQPGGVVKVDGRWVANPEAENIANLPAGYYTKQLAGKEEDWIRVYLAAEYGYVVDGRPVYPEFRDGVHVGEVEPVPGLPLVIGVDFGLTPAAVVGQSMADGQWIVLDELVTEDMGIPRFASLLNKRLAQRFPDHAPASISVWADPAGAARSANDEKTAIAILAENTGLKVRPAPVPDNDFVIRREAVAGPLGRMIDGRPGLVLSPRCKVLRKGFAGGYRFKRLKVAGEERYHEKPDKNSFSHPHDALQYMMLGGGEGGVILGRHERRRRRERSEEEDTAIMITDVHNCGLG